MNQDLEHLRLLSIFHYVLAGITAVCSCFPIFHLIIGIILLEAPQWMEPPKHGPGDEVPMLVIVLLRPSVQALFDAERSRAQF